MHCQKCRTSLKLDGSLEDLNPASFKLLTGLAGLLNGVTKQTLTKNRLDWLEAAAPPSWTAFKTCVLTRPAR